jgi:hypothetical protein
LAWGAFVFACENASARSEEFYRGLATDEGFLRRLPVSAQPEDLARLREFLVNYGVHYAPKDLPVQYARIWPQITRHASRLVPENLLTCDLSDGSETAERIAATYTPLQDGRVWGGDTVAAKVAHFLNVDLFVMWDNYIKGTFGLVGPKGYVEYLRLAQAAGREAAQDFEVLALPGTPETYLSEKLGYPMTRPFTKLLDDYYWVTITKKWPARPPEWLLGLLTT